MGYGATLHCAILDKRSAIQPGRTLMGHETYPLVIGKDLEI